MAPTVVLVTGVSRFFGGHLAARLAAHSEIARVIGVDTVSPTRDLLRRMGRAEFIRADIRNPMIGRIVRNHNVDTVVHTGIATNPAEFGSRVAMKELNVIGTMQLFAACQKVESVRKVVVRSSADVYGSGSKDPALFTEDMEPRGGSSGFAKDISEIEGYCRGLGRRRPDLSITLLRLGTTLGPNLDSSLGRYLAMPLVPTVFGHDARLQLLHEQDGVQVLERAAVSDLPGVFNVAGDGTLSLSQAVLRAGRWPVAMPAQAITRLAPVTNKVGLTSYTPSQRRYITFGRVLDNTKLKTEFGYRPRWDTPSALDDFVQGRGLRPVIDPARLDGVERGVRQLLAKVR